MEETGKIVEGFYFAEAKEAQKAKQEAEGVLYIKSKLNMDNPKMLVKMYHKVIEEHLFETAVGLTFLKELRDYILEFPEIEEKMLAPIAVEHTQEKVKRQEQWDKREEKSRKEAQKIRKKLGISLCANLFLVIMAAGMLVINFSSKHPNIINYENQIIEKYTQWEQELSQRERAVKEKEQELGILP